VHLNMTISAALAACLILLVSCGGQGVEASPCVDMCETLIFDCRYAAFPDEESCLQGCGYNETEGGDIEGQLQCVEEASCDTFAIVECENLYGATSDD